MPIIFPENCKGLTTGALRQLKQQGHTTASGGFMSTKFVKSIQADTKTFFESREPTGEFMEKIETAKQQIEDISEAITKASGQMVDTARVANKKMIEVSAKMRDGAEKLGLSIEKMLKIAGNNDFADVVKRAESFVTSLERLSELEKNGMLEKVIRSMSVK